MSIAPGSAPLSRGGGRARSQDGCTVSHLGASHADNTVDIAGGIVEVGDCQCVLASRDPVPLGGWIDLEDMGPGAEDRLFPAVGRGGGVEKMMEHHCREQILVTLQVYSCKGCLSALFWAKNISGTAAREVDLEKISHRARKGFVKSLGRKGNGGCRHLRRAGGLWGWVTG